MTLLACPDPDCAVLNDVGAVNCSECGKALLPGPVSKAKRLYPESFARVRGVCEHASDNIDLDHHAATIVLTANGARP